MARREKEDDDKGFDAFYRRLMKSNGLADIQKYYYIVTDSRRNHKFYDEIQFLRFLLADLTNIFYDLIQTATTLSKHPSDIVSVFIYNDLKKANKLDELAGQADKIFPLYMKLLVLINESKIKPDKKEMVKAYNENLTLLYDLEAERNNLLGTLLKQREREASKKQKDVYIG